MSPNSESFVLRSTRVLVDGQWAPRTVFVAHGVIQSVEPYDAPVRGLPLSDWGNLVLMAGLTDVHVHINEPGRTEWEGFLTATHAAAAGGVTTLIDMPLNSTPVTTTASAFEAKLAATRGTLAVDVGFWGGVVPADIDELPGLLASGVLGLKAFLVHSGIEDFPNVDRADLERALPLLAPTGLPLLVHCELDAAGAPAPEAPNPRSYAQYLASRPGQWEEDAIKLVLELCRQTGARVHIVHLSYAGALPLIKAAKEEGLPVTVETCPHYLVLDAERIPDGDTRFKCAPPIRDRENREQLWAGLADGTIDFIATDHSPCPPDLKRLDEGDFIRAWGGIASLQFLLPVVWTEARSRGFTLGHLEQWLVRRPAQWAGLGPTKGRIAPGYDADLVAWDPNGLISIAPETMVYRHKISPYTNQDWLGRVEQTWLRGQRVLGGETIPRGGRPLLRSVGWVDTVPDSDAMAWLLSCCASSVWAREVVRNRPWKTFAALSQWATSAWDALDDEEKKEAMNAHPRIGEKFRDHPEQAGVVGASEQVLDQLARLNAAYEQRFGYRFLVFATGKTAPQMVEILERRLQNSPESEWDTACRQLHKITLFRLAQARMP